MDEASLNDSKSLLYQAQVQVNSPAVLEGKDILEFPTNLCFRFLLLKDVYQILLEGLWVRVLARLATRRLNSLL